MPSAQLPAASGSKPSRPRLSVVLAGHVDHGKSTIVGRLLNDLGLLPEDKEASLRAACRRRGQNFEWAYITDALMAERSQGVTIDSGHIWLRDATRDMVLIDAPGHHEFIRNMVSGAAAADAALLIVDARESLCEQARRHAYILHLLGIRQICAIVNKIDLIDFSQNRFNTLAGEIAHYLGRVGLSPMTVIPTVGPDGDNIVTRSTRMDWYDGPTLYEAMTSFAPRPDATGRSLRLRVQDVYRDGEQRTIVGRIGAGRLRVGDQVMISPGNVTARVSALRAWLPNGGDAPNEAEAGQSVGLTIDQPLFVGRGDVISHTLDMPFETSGFTARIFWFSQSPLRAGQNLTLKLGCAESRAAVTAIKSVIDLEEGIPRPQDHVARNGLAEVTITCPGMLAIDSFEKDPEGGRFMLLDGGQVVGGGTVLLDGYIDQRPSANPSTHNIFTTSHRVTPEERASRNGCRGGVYWLTGLSGAGKSTIAMGTEHALFRLGYPVYVLDGDNLRHGLNIDLGFSPEDRVENLRRAGEVAALFANAGVIVLAAFISPYASERHRVRAMVPDGAFHEVHVKASVETCESRDPKGLYARARKGEIAEFTGISAPYEVPEAADLTIDTQALTAEQAIELLTAYCRDHSQT